MSYQSDIYDAVLGSVALTEIIGDRFFWDVADAATLAPYLVAQTVSGSGETDLDGRRDVSFPLVQFSAWAASKAQAVALVSIIRAELEGRDLDGPSNVSMGYSGESSTYERETRLYGETLDLRVSTLSN
jgi:hypothetical protein